MYSSSVFWGGCPWIRRRRAKLNKILEDLRALLPDSKSTTSSLLDEAIQRIHNLTDEIRRLDATNVDLENQITKLSATHTTTAATTTTNTTNNSTSSTTSTTAT
jgi:phage shock protein A